MYFNFDLSFCRVGMQLFTTDNISEEFKGVYVMENDCIESWY